MPDWPSQAAARRRAPGPRATSPLASSVFIRSRNPESSTLDSSMMNAIFSFLQPERLSTVRRSSSKSSPVYFLCTCGRGSGLGALRPGGPRAGVRASPGGGREATHLDLVDAQTVHPGHEPGQGGLPGPADTDQQQVALGLAEYPETAPERARRRAFELQPPRDTPVLGSPLRCFQWAVT